MKNRKILIVEDDAFSRGVMEKLLQSYDYETFSCALAEEAIARLKQESFNILISDLHMPGMDGFELIRNARKIQPGLSTILVTGFPAEEIKLKVREERVDGFFSKPVDWDELYALLDTLSRRTGTAHSPDMPLNIRKGNRPFLSGGIVFALILSILTLLCIQPLKAQPPFYPQNKPPMRLDSQETCWQLPDLALTQTQIKTLEGLQCAYSAEAMPLLREIRTLVLELHHLASDTKVKPQALLERGKKISGLRTELENLSFSYQIKARSIFTKEQLDRLPQDCSLGLSTGYEIPIGIGRGPRRGLR
jgi:DNA-binding response OmpR family regulator